MSYHELDFISDGTSSTKSSDAATARFFFPDENREVVIVIDGGYTDTGDEIVNHLDQYYETNVVDLMIATHPDADHINGLITAIQQLEVKELLVHMPWLHAEDTSEFKNIEAIEELVAYATDKGVTITEPFTGLNRFGARVIVLGPTEPFYRTLIQAHLDEVQRGLRPRFSSGITAQISSLFDRALASLPLETLGDGGETGPRNNSSVITLLNVNGRRLLLTGDAGIPALEAAADFYENVFGSFADFPLRLFQAPHHGSKRNVGKTILNRILGGPSNPHSADLSVFINAAKNSVKHPSPKVTNAVMRRGCRPTRLAVTQGGHKWHHYNTPDREGYSMIDPYPMLPEED